MKTLLLSLLFSSFVFGQDISPYYPAQQPEAIQGNESTQLTYYDSVFVQMAVQGFVNNRLGMTLLNSDTTNAGSIYKFQDKFSDGVLTITIDQSAVNVNAPLPEIATSLKISGTKDRVFSFFTNYWDTTIDWDAKKSDVERRHMQDIIRLHFNNGKPYITVTNATYKTPKEFETFFNDLKAKEGKTNTNL